jgi:copper amine oxidase-like protein
MTYRRPAWQTLTLTAAVAGVAAAMLAFARPTEVLVDGQRLDADVPAVTEAGGKVYVPLRAVAQALGADVSVDARSGDVLVARGDKTLRLDVGDVHAKLNGMPMTLNHAPFRVRGRVMIGLNTVARAFDVYVHYDPRTARADVLTPGIGIASPAAANEAETQ